MKLSRSSYLIAPTSYLSHGFTLVELMVSIGIFTMMTALVVAKYSNFNGSVLMTNLAYEVALTIRTAQTYGLSVKNNVLPNGSITSDFQSGYGVHFDKISGTSNRQIILFADRDGNGKYTPNAVQSEDVSTYAIKRGATIYQMCMTVGCGVSSPQNNNSFLDVIFTRPDPKANICSYNNVADDCRPGSPNLVPYAEIIIKGTDGSPRTVVVRENGQISVKE